MALTKFTPISNASYEGTDVHGQDFLIEVIDADTATPSIQITGTDVALNAQDSGQLAAILNEFTNNGRLA